MLNGPMPYTFETANKKTLVEGEVLSDEDAVQGATAYILFLKTREDGRLEPVSGQIDSADSFKKLVNP